MNIKQIQKMMKQAQQMQGQVEEIQNEIDAKEFVKSAGGGMVTITMYGSKVIKEISIKEEILNKDEKEDLEEMIKMTLNQLIEEIGEQTKEKLDPITKGLPI